MNLDENNDSNDNENDSHTDLDPVEIEALQKGWKPEEEWKGDPSKWRPAKEFLDRESFFKKIESQSKEIRDLKAAINALGEHNTKIAKLEREKAIKELKEQKKEALQEQDFDKLDEIDTSLNALQNSPDPKFQPVPQNSEDESEDFVEFKKRNSEWYQVDQELTDLAETLAGGYIMKAQLAKKPFTASEVYLYVEKEISKKMDKDQKDTSNNSQNSNSGVASNKTRQTSANTRQTKGKSKFTVNDLSEQQRRFGQRFVEAGAHKNIQEYVDKLVELGELQ